MVDPCCVVPVAHTSPGRRRGWSRADAVAIAVAVAVALLIAAPASRLLVHSLRTERPVPVIVLKMLFEQIDPPAVQRHRRSVGQLESVLRVHLEDRVFRRRIARVGFEDDVHGSTASAVVVADARAE